MIRIIELISTDRDCIRVKATLDGENKTPYGYIIPQDTLVPIRLWGAKIDTPIFEYDVYTLLKK